MGHLTIKKVKEGIDTLQNATQEKLFVIVDEYGVHHCITEMKLKTVNMYYDKSNELSGCFTEMQMRMMNIPKEQWAFDHEDVVAVFKSEQL